MESRVLCGIYNTYKFTFSNVLNFTGCAPPNFYLLQKVESGRLAIAYTSLRQAVHSQRAAVIALQCRY